MLCAAFKPAPTTRGTPPGCGADHSGDGSRGNCLRTNCALLVLAVCARNWATPRRAEAARDVHVMLLLTQLAEFAEPRPGDLDTVVAAETS